MGADPTGNIWPKAEWRLPGNGHNEADSGAWEVDRSFRTESDAADQFRYRTLTIEDKASRDRQISPQPERPACELRRSTPRRHARRDSSDGGHGEFPGQSSDEQVAADALVSASRRPGAASPLRSLQRDAWFRLRSTVRTHRPARCNCQNRRVIPPVSGHSRRNLAAFYRWNTEYEQSASKARWGRIRSGASRTIRAQPCWQPRSRRLGKHRNGSPLSKRAT